MSQQRTHYTSELADAKEGTEATLCGWVHRRRDHGNLIFIDLRDREGLVQLVFDPTHDAEVHKQADSLRNESVVAVHGHVRQRPQGMHNDKLPTGQIEVLADKLTIFDHAEPIPLRLDIEPESGSTIAMKYRYLDLRRPALLENFKLRHHICHLMREVLNGEGFLEVETPFLTKSTPEGARDFLVPSRVQLGNFYALPQSPQLFKQLLMVAGFDRYFQIVRCFRDEDLRADRQPEFTQLDLEMSFVTPAEVQGVIENIFGALFTQIVGQPLTLPLDHLTYAEAMGRYGSDKPDRRYPIEIVDLSSHFQATEFNIFRSILDADGSIHGFSIPLHKEMSRAQLEGLIDIVSPLGIKGVVWVKMDGGRLQSPIAKFLSDSEQDALKGTFGLAENRLGVMIAGQKQVALPALGTLRLHLIEHMEMKPEKEYDLLWVDDFPLFEKGSDGSVGSSHHPFTSPHPDDLERLESDPFSVRSTSYDLVMNGSELGSGSIRIHDTALQQRIFELLNLDQEAIKERFGFFLEALRYGTPPHGGIALGLDRIVMLFAGAPSLREVIAFPKTQQGLCLTTEAPARATHEQLAELSLKIVQPKK